MGRNSAEYRVLKHMNDLLLSIENDLSAVIANLTSRLLINPEQGRAIISTAAARINKDRACELLCIILNKIEINEENYHNRPIDVQASSLVSLFSQCACAVGICTP